MSFGGIASTVVRQRQASGARDGGVADDRGFLSEFYSEIVHQGRCLPYTADGVPLLPSATGDGSDDEAVHRHGFEMYQAGASRRNGYPGMSDRATLPADPPLARAGPPSVSGETP